VPHRLTRLVAAVAVIGGLTGVGTGAASQPSASAQSLYPSSSVTVTGHGFGHGRGMGQWGAFGYAANYGYSYQQILAHYFGGTTLATVPESNITVNLSAFTQGMVAVTATSGTSLAATYGTTAVGAQAVQITEAGGIETLSTGPGCAGPWTKVTSTSATVAVATAQSAGATPTPDQPASSELAVCMPGANPRLYQGDIVMEPSGQVQNYLPLEDYVDGVVPQESLASWANFGGEAALEAQAVAARSYALATVATSGAICDNTACQMYLGLPDQYGETADAAVAATAGQVLECQAGSTCGAAGSIAYTEYSASTGGYTAGGAFPAVVDLGDAVAANPSHNWTTTLSVSAIEAAYPSVGALESITVTGRNGLGDMGGRVTSMTLTGSAGSQTVTGNDFAAAFGLQSDWFSVAAGTTPAGTTSSPPAGPASNPITVTPAAGADDGYWIPDSAGNVHTFGAAPLLGNAVGTTLAGQLVGMSPTVDDQGYWLVGANGGVLALGDATWHGSASKLRLNSPVLGMTTTPSGNGYWLVAGDGGIFTYGDGAFYGSTGGMHLDKPVVGMAATADGHGYWLVAADGGIFAFGDARFYGSMGGRHLDQPMVGMVPSADGRGYFLVARDGGVFAFGDATFAGSLPGEHIAAQVVAVAPTSDDGGYYLVSAGGTVYTFGDAVKMGDLASQSGWQGSAVGIVLHRAVG
jgi:SpoIID/LytB domain protein